MNHADSKTVKISDVSGLELKETLFRSNAREPVHSHEGSLFCIALKGSCTESYRGRDCDYRPFGVEFLPAGHTHSLKVGTTALHSFSVGVPSFWLEKMHDCGGLLREAIQPVGGRVSEILLRLFAEYREPDEVTPLAIEGLTLELLASVSRHALTTERKLSPWLVNARDFLEANFANQLRLDAVAAAVGVHPVHLAREFRKHFGKTVGDYVRTKRIEFARLQLISTDATLADIALTAGFCDQSHFSRIFKQMVGTTPADYRSRHSVIKS